MRAWHSLALVSVLAATVAASARAQEPRPLVVTAENLMAGDAQHEAMAAAGRSATELLPGDVVRYTLRFTNVTEQPVRNVVFDNPLPRGLRYVMGSADAGAEDVAIAYSIDGGQSYSAQPMVEQLVDGERVLVPAPAAMYTHVRWTLRDWVQPGAQVTAEFQAQLIAPESKPEGSR